MITSEEIDYITSKYSSKGSGCDPTKVLSAGRLSWASNSGSRQQMFTSQIKQAVVLKNPEVPRLSTGHEKFFGKHADSFKKAKDDFRIISKISRYSTNPSLLYVLVLQNIHDGSYDVVEVKHYEKLTDCHGYVREETPVDHMMPGQIIPKGEYFYKASTIDENDNYRFGVNCNVAFMTLMGNIEDSIIVSRQFADRTRFSLIEKVEFSYDINHVALNLYGNTQNYKCLPEIGEQTFDGSILCAIRPVTNKNIASDLTVDALSHPKGTDTIIKGRGRLIDISIHTNQAEKLEEDEHRSQINRMYLDELRFHREIVDTLGRIVNNKNNKVSDMFKHILNISRNYVDPNVKFSSDNGEFEFCYITAYVEYETTLNECYKMTNRHGGKGVISGEIVDEEFMPVDEDGVRADMIVASAGVVPRMNPEQKYEHELNFIADKFVRHHLMKEQSHEKQVKMLHEFVSMINKEYADSLLKYMCSLTKYEQQKMIREIAEEGLYLQLPPFNDFMNIDSLGALYKKYDIKPGYVRMRRRYTDEVSGDIYVTKEYSDKLKDLSENFCYEQPKKGDEFVGMCQTDFSSQKKNPLKLDPKTYKNNKWTDDYIWSEGKIGEFDKDKSVEKRLDLSVVVNDVLDSITKENFNDPRTKIFRNPDGSITREFRSLRPIIIASVYYMVLKHIPEAKKFSARNLGSCSLLGLPCKSNKNSIGLPYPDTSNRCGEMETECLNRRVSNLFTARYAATHATNPEYVLESARQQLLEDPLDLHDVNIPDGIPKDTIPARTLRAYLAAIGTNILETGERDPFEWFDNTDFKDVNDMMNYIKKNQKKKEHSNGNE